MKPPAVALPNIFFLLIRKLLHLKKITEGLPGIPLTLVFHVFAVSSHLSDPTLAHSTCEPLPNAWIDIWSCDAVDGVYSGYGKAAEGPGPGRPPGGPPGGPGRPGGPHKGPHGPGGPGEDRPPMHQEPINVGLPI